MLRTMQLTGSHLARVVDDEGQELGVVFLEDVLEELVGEVTDPHTARPAGAEAGAARRFGCAGQV